MTTRDTMDMPRPVPRAEHGDEAAETGLLEPVHTVGLVRTLRWSLRQFTVAGSYSRVLSPESRRRFCGGQLAATFSMTGPMMLGNLVFAPTLTWVVYARRDALDASLVWGMIVWCALVMMIACKQSLTAIQHSRRASRRPSGSEASIRRFIRATAFIAILWALPIAVLFPRLDGAAFGLLTAIMAGILPAGSMALSRVPRPALVWISVVGGMEVGVAALCWTRSGSNVDLFIAIIAAVAIYCLAVGIRERSMSALNAFVINENLAEKNEVVDLLLQDYEKDASAWQWQTDKYGNLLRAPGPLMDIVGLGEDVIDGHNLLTLVLERTIDTGDGSRERMAAAVADLTDITDVMLCVPDRREGQNLWIMVRGRAQFENGVFTGYRGICADATATETAERRIRHMADHDSLTGLFTRRAFHDQLTRWRSDGRRFAFMLIDLDRFKAVNDTLGHAAGDDLLRQVSARLLAAGGDCAATPEHLAVARYGGDEFAMACCVEDDACPNEVVTLGDRLAASVVAGAARTFMIDDTAVSIGASVGWVAAPEDGDTIGVLSKRADLALYRSKDEGRSTWRRFTPFMDEQARDKAQLEREIGDALHNGELSLAYMPIMAVDAASATEPHRTGMEALLRWHHPQRGTVAPDTFIPAAESTGAIIAMGEWVLREACREAATWNDDLVVAVNLSPLQLQAPGFVSTVMGALAAAALPPHCLELELTEIALALDGPRVGDTVTQLRALGVRVSLDDFGTGHSSLSTLARFELDRIKIDRTFVRDLTETPNDRAPAILQAIASLTGPLGFDVVAEGVETQEQAAALAELGCLHQQGFFYGGPQEMESADQTDSAREVDAQLPNRSTAA